MNLNKQFLGRKKRLTKYKALAEKLNLQCSYCKSYLQTITSLVIGEAVINCNSCGNVWTKEIMEDSECTAE